MKQRITYILPQGTGIDPADIEVKNDGLKFRKAGDAAEESRLTLGLDDIPAELRLILENLHELHLRWISSRNDQLISPLVSRLSAGLHIFFTPRRSAEDMPLCSLIQKLVGSNEAKCCYVEETFSKPPILSERFASASTYQYHQNAPITSSLGQTFLGKLCNSAAGNGAGANACKAQINSLEQATYVDVDFDAISHAVTLTALRSPTIESKTEARPIREWGNQDRLEVGVLQAEKPNEPEELSLGGYLTVVGEDDHPKATMFSFPSRHHLLPVDFQTTFKSRFQHPSGLHPKLQIALPRNHLLPPKPGACGLHAYLTLPSSLFIDRYQLSDPLFLASQNLIALHSLSGEQDLEAPDWVVKSWGSAALFELATPSSSKPPEPAGSQGPWIITIPTHLRYLSANTTSTSAENSEPHSSITAIQIPTPILFWACEAETGLKFSTNPFDRTNLGYDGLFGPKTMFYHIPPSNNQSQILELQVPVLDAGNAALVQMGTLTAVAAGFVWVCLRLLRNANLFKTTASGAARSPTSQAKKDR